MYPLFFGFPPIVKNMKLDAVGKYGIIANSFFNGDDKLIPFKFNFYKASDL